MTDPKLRDALESFDAGQSGARMHALIRELYPLPRSLTGDGVRRTLAVLKDLIPLEVVEVPSGTAAFDWKVPREWNVREAFVKGPDGEVVVDFRASNLHLVGYSVPFRGKLPLEELKKHLHSLPAQPSRVPYRTSYYSESWGFCLPHEQLQRLRPGEYEVVIDATLADGSLTWGEALLPGASPDEVLFSAHCCHPSLCNDNLSGIAVAVELARALARVPRRYSYRFLFAPATLGAIAWLARNREAAPRIRHGLILAGVGDEGSITYKRSRRGDAEIDRAAAHVLGHSAAKFAVRDFSPYGYDERQFCSPGFDLAVGSLARTPFGEYPEYHTSGDDPSFVKPASLSDSLRRALEIVEVLEGNRKYLNLSPHCEPQLGKRGLYGPVGGQSHAYPDQMAMLWVLNQSDGQRDLLGIAERAGIPFHKIRSAASALEQASLLRAVHDG